MKRYESKKHAGVFATVISCEEKFKTVMLQFDDGKCQSISTATLKRWWVLVDDNYDPNAKDDVETGVLVETADDITDIQKVDTEQTDTVDDEPKAEETPADADKEEVPTDAEISAGPIEKPKRTRKKGTKGASVATETIDTFREQIETALEKEFGLTKVSYAMDNVTLFRADKKTVIRLYFGKRNLVFHTRPEIVPEGVEYDTYKYFLSAVFHKDYSEDTMDFIKSLISVYKNNKANN